MGHVGFALSVVGKVLKCEFGLDIVSFNILIEVMCRNCMVDCARKVFGEMPEKNIVTYGILVNGLCKWEMLMKSDGITVDEGRKLFDVMMCDRDVISYNVLINGYCKNDMVDKATNG
nr:hypothetical protein [Tanacetum cinerariifolium]